MKRDAISSEWRIRDELRGIAGIFPEGEDAVGRYMPEKTFMMMPPLIINSIAKIAGRSGFCL